LFEFYVYARYKSHDAATLSYMEDSLHCVHTFNDVFLLGWAGEKAKAKANALRTELVMKWKLDKETYTETWTTSKTWWELNASQDHISFDIDVLKELDADFHFPKIHLMSHWVEQIHWYGALEWYSAKRHEQAHKMNLKDGCNTSNHNPNYLPLVIMLQRRILSFEMSELKLQALAQRPENGADGCKVLPSGADLAAPLSSQSYGEPEFMGPQNRRDGKHSDTMTKDFRASLDNMQNAMHRVAIYSGTWEFIKHMTRNTTYLPDE